MESMIFECRTYDPNGKLKYVKSPEECTAHFYRDFQVPKVRLPKDKKWSKKINCIICGDKVTVFSKRGIKCKKKACKEGLRKLREKQKKDLKLDTVGVLNG